MTYWPGTNIRKSENNVFTLWKQAKTSKVLEDKFLIMSENAKRNIANSKKVQIVISRKK